MVTGGESVTQTVEDINDTEITIRMLLPYTTYIVVVYAFTDQGRGNGSDPLTALTDEDCKS